MLSEIDESLDSRGVLQVCPVESRVYKSILNRRIRNRYSLDVNHPIFDILHYCTTECNDD
jgi:hypothetical protein